MSVIDAKTIHDYNLGRLANLIKDVSDLHGGDDPQFLAEYIAEVTKEWSNDLNKAIDCFEDLKQQAINLYGNYTFKEYHERLAKQKARERMDTPQQKV